MNVAAVIPARGGSEGIPKKNLVTFVSKPLLAYSIEQAAESKLINKGIYVSSDSEEILAISSEYGANEIRRPGSISGATATSESALEHALDFIKKKVGEVDYIVFLQATSPLRDVGDIDKAIHECVTSKSDSLFSAVAALDLCLWDFNGESPQSISYDFNKRSRRQDIKDLVIENGSIYVFKPYVLSKFKNRIGGRIGKYMMKEWQLYEIDSYEDLIFCENMYKRKLINND